MKKSRFFFFLLVSCFFLFGCAAPALEDLPPDTPLLSINGETLISSQDFATKKLEQELSGEMLGTTVREDEELFFYMAEYRVASYLAELAGVGVEDALLEEEYDSHMSEIQDTEVYPNQLAFTQAFQEQAGFTDEQMKTWNTEEYRYQLNAEALTTSIARDFGNLADAFEIEWAIRDNLDAFLSMQELTCSYPGLSDYTPAWDYLL